MVLYRPDNLSSVLTAILDDSQLKQSVTFLSLKPRMTELLLRFLRAETDAANTQMLLGNCYFALSVGVLVKCKTAVQNCSNMFIINVIIGRLKERSCANSITSLHVISRCLAVCSLKLSSLTSVIIVWSLLGVLTSSHSAISNS